MMKTERTTTAGIFIKDGKVLVAKRIEGGAISEKWEFPGGKNRWGESVADTLTREYREELEVDIIVKKEILSFDFENKNTLYHLKAMLIDIPKPDYVLHFHSELMMVDSKTLANLDFASSDKKIASYLVENKFL